jgi:peptidoglycan/LPS O-acetylase OafA/YrhL
LAILLVLTAHLVPYHATRSVGGRLMNGIAGIGWTGVSLFFVLSGFLITGILFDSKEQENYFRNFYARRALRIMPLYFLMVVMCTVVFPHFTRTAAAEPTEDGWMYWVYLSNLHDSFRAWSADGWLGPFWSLTVEEHFYLVWPAVILWTRRRGAMEVCAVCLATATLMRVWFVMQGNPHAPYVFTLCRIDDLAMGSLMALLLRGQLRRRELARTARRFALVMGSLGVAVAVWTHGVIFDPIVQLIGMPVFAMLFAALLVLAVLPGFAMPWTRVLETPVLRFFGRYSYGLYVLHPAVAGMMPRVIVFAPGWIRANDMVNAGLVLGVSVGVAMVSWTLYESRFLRLKRYFQNDAANRGQVYETRIGTTPDGQSVSL